METKRILGRVIEIRKGKYNSILEVDVKNDQIYLCELPKSTIYIEEDDNICFDTSTTSTCKWGTYKGKLLHVIPHDDCEVAIPNDSESTFSAFRMCFGTNRCDYMYDAFVASVEQISIYTPTEWLNDNAEYETHIYTPSYSKIYRWWTYHRLIRRLLNLGLNNQTIDLCKYYSNSKSLYHLYKMILTQPLHIVPITLEDSINLCHRLGISYTDEDLYIGRVARTLYDYVENSRNACMSCSKLKQEYNDIDKYWEKIHSIYKVSIHCDAYYFDVNWNAEHGLSDVIRGLINSNPQNLVEIPVEYTRKDLHKEQQSAIQLSLNNPISIITGGAGNGKTTVINELVINLVNMKRPYLLSSFTGKAVARIREVTATFSNVLTMHMILAKRLTTTHLIIDEASMVTSKLLYEVLLMCKCKYLTLIGDPNQLPPIQWGNVLKQVLTVDKIPKVHLSVNHRKNAMVTVLNKHGDLVPTQACTISTGNISTVISSFEQLLLEGVYASDIIIISPVNSCVDQINIECQKVRDTGQPSLTDIFDRKFILGDRVMLVENDKQGGNNGDLGSIVYIDTETRLVHVQFPHELRKFKAAWKVNTLIMDKSNTTEVLRIAYCITIHKSQGSQWRHVKLYIPPGYKHIEFYNFYLIYTAISRTMHRLYIYGDIAGLQEAIKWVPPAREENLAKLITSDEY